MVSSDNSIATELQQQQNLPYLYTIQCGDHQWPIVYRDSYNISFIGIEKLQSTFDTNKWRSIHQKLVGELHIEVLAEHISMRQTIVLSYM